MANIRFASKEVFDLYREMCDKTHDLGDHSLASCVSRLLYWGPAETTITVYRDTCDKLSFYFVQKWDDWQTNTDHEKMIMNGGIVLHGSRDGFGSGDGPTFSVSMDKSEGYQVHT
jgi:hypothetical protein